MASSGRGQTLKQKLVTGSKQSCFDKRQYVPESCLQELITKDSIAAELKKEKIEVKIELLVFVYEKAKRIFAILVCSRMTKFIVGFHERGFIDDHLPVRCLEVGEDYALSSLSEKQPSCGLWNWKWDDLYEFIDKQWLFMSPIFERSRGRYNLNKDQALPFDSVGREKSGGFSKVYPVTIHPAHQRGYSNEQLERMHREEGEVLEMIRELDPPHPHLIEVFALIEREDETYFLFPWANGGNLRDVWENENPGNPNIDWIDWAIDQLLGLSQAICRLHHLDDSRNCRHGDLKPENILCFKNEDEPGTKGTLVIADVGLAKVHTNSTYQRAGRHILTIAMSGTQRYEPPDLLDKVPRSRVYDIWSFGCICLEFIIWLLYGKDGLQRFNDGFMYLKFWTAPAKAIESKQAFLEGEVYKWMRWIRKHDPRVTTDTALRALLDLVQDRLLQIRVDRSGRNTTSTDFRAQSNEVSQILRNIRTKAKRGSPYLEKCTKQPDPVLHGPSIESRTQQAPRPRLGDQNLQVPGNVPALAERPRNHQQDGEGVQQEEQFNEILVGSTASEEGPWDLGPMLASPVRFEHPAEEASNVSSNLDQNK
ncbi:hypothetical protein H2200_000154 [Cladophialophora chaetospira]|uniref:Protein kinase domain-containing protein n=1 Tax=Cladophialophora chaetospira TaxID=386627 RepID=A0AA39CQP7_9EURO|nr:hypothetical protein H2200_000154 [Cladophialophora chaetospira]